MFENCDDGFIKALVQLLQPQARRRPRPRARALVFHTRAWRRVSGPPLWKRKHEPMVLTDAPAPHHLAPLSLPATSGAAQG